MRHLKTSLKSALLRQILTGQIRPRKGKLSSVKKSGSSKIVRARDISVRPRRITTTVNRASLTHLLTAKKIIVRPGRLSRRKKGQAIVFPKDLSET